MSTFFCVMIFEVKLCDFQLCLPCSEKYHSLDRLEVVLQDIVSLQMFFSAESIARSLILNFFINAFVRTSESFGYM